MGLRTSWLLAAIAATARVPYAAAALRVQRVADLQAELAEKDALLQVARGDLFRDEQIFADKLQEVARLQVELASTTERARLKEEEMTACLQHLQADLRR